MFSRGGIFIDAFLKEDSGDSVPAWFGCVVGMPGGIVFFKVEGWIGTAEVVEVNRVECVDLWQLREILGTTEDGCFGACVMFIDKFTQVFQILSPIIIGIGGNHIATCMAAYERIIIGKITGIDTERNEEKRGKKKSGDWSKDIPEFFGVTLVEVHGRFGHEEVEEGHNWEEVTEADVEITSDADVGIEQNKETSEVLSRVCLERSGKDGEACGGRFFVE